MTPETTAKKPPRTYRGGDTLTTKLSLAPGHVVPQTAIAYFGRSEAQQGPYDPNRTTSFGISAGMIAAPPEGLPLVLTLSGTIPHHIIGGTYKPVNVTFIVPDSSNMIDTNPDPDGDLTITIADDPPTGASKPVIQDFDLA